MTAIATAPTKKPARETSGRLFFLDIFGDRIISTNPDGSDLKVLLEDGRKILPDGIILDVVAGHIYWTNMGVIGANNGSIDRMNLDGSNLTSVVPTGTTHTPKQLVMDKKNGKLYWSDREGMRVMRSNLDGSHLETLVETGHGETDRQDARNWCVGIAVDAERGQMYWTQKGNDNAGQGRIFRANLEIPKGESSANRTDIEVFFENLPEPIDLEIDHATRTLYWTDRGDPPRGNTVNRAGLDADPKKPTEPEILLGGLNEGIGIALDLKGNRMFITDLNGSLYSANLDGSGKKTLVSGLGGLTGVAYAEIPTNA
ncbi:MAG: 3-hydroxyacyl-CoA dehydrogenase [Chthonomonadaceae bacterium]|nr:3-hydroxyacyl-CoA dehydrogenase [Chthonomonadaceae bacterium]